MTQYILIALRGVMTMGAIMVIAMIMTLCSIVIGSIATLPSNLVSKCHDSENYHEQVFLRN